MQEDRENQKLQDKADRYNTGWMAHFEAMQAKYGAGGARDRERTSRRESPSATPQAGRSSRAAGTATARTPGEKSRLLEKRDRRGGRGSKEGSRGGFNFCKVSDTPATSPAAIDENAA